MKKGARSILNKLTDEFTLKDISENKIVKQMCDYIKLHISDTKTARRSIKTVYIFGSVLDSNQFKPGSDIDIAFLIDKDLFKDDPLVSTSSAYLLASKIGLLLDRQTDVIILNSASIETSYQVVTTGKLIYEFDNNLRIEYEIALKGLYYDFKPFLTTLRSPHLSTLNGNIVAT